MDSSGFITLSTPNWDMMLTTTLFLTITCFISLEIPEIAMNKDDQFNKLVEGVLKMAEKQGLDQVGVLKVMEYCSYKKLEIRQ